MTTKILLMVMLVTALRQGAAQSCRRRSDLAVMHKLRATTRCKAPQDYLVKLPVPKGFDYVRPSVAKLKQCTGLSCQVFPDKCLPDPQYITTKTFRVNAYRVNDHTPHCEEVQVEEHGACECRCEEIDCPPNQVFNDDTCECECIWAREEDCSVRRAEGYEVMWSEDTCSCLCDHYELCGTGETWVEQSCSCERIY